MHFHTAARARGTGHPGLCGGHLYSLQAPNETSPPPQPREQEAKHRRGQSKAGPAALQALLSAVAHLRADTASEKPSARPALRRRK